MRLLIIDSPTVWSSTPFSSRKIVLGAHKVSSHSTAFPKNNLANIDGSNTSHTAFWAPPLPRQAISPFSERLEVVASVSIYEELRSSGGIVGVDVASQEEFDEEESERWERRDEDVCVPSEKPSDAMYDPNARKGIRCLDFYLSQQTIPQVFLSNNYD